MRLSVLMLAALAGGSIPGQGQTLRLQPCHLAESDVQFECGVHEVWENRAARSGRRIPLRVVRLAAGSPTAEPDPIVVLQGGPGQSNVGTAPFFASSPLRARRALLFIDVRGTGASHPLNCDFGDAGRREFLPADGVRYCADSLSRIAELALYTTPHVVDDVAEVLTALGVARANLWGFSGGTRQALVFMRRYPDKVRSALLEGPVPVDAKLPLTFAADAQEALDGVLDECLAEEACRHRFPNVKREFSAVLNALDAAPLRIPAERGARDSLTVTRAAWAQVIRYMLYQPQSTRSLPLAIHLATQGDFSLVASRIRTLGVPGGISFGFYLSNTCAEDVPWFSMADAVARAAGTFLGDYRARQQKSACEHWPRGDLGVDYLQPVASDLPVLVLVGERDPVTPPRWGEEVTRNLTRARLVVVPDGGHGFAGLTGETCITRLRQLFLEELTPGGLDLECLQSVRRPPFLLQVQR